MPESFYTAFDFKITSVNSKTKIQKEILYSKAGFKLLFYRFLVYKNKFNL